MAQAKAIKTRRSSTKAPAKTPPKTATEIKQETDAMLDEIDTVLEESVVARNFVQKGGQ